MPQFSQIQKIENINTKYFKERPLNSTVYSALRWTVMVNSINLRIKLLPPLSRLPQQKTTTVSMQDQEFILTSPGCCLRTVTSL